MDKTGMIYVLCLFALLTGFLSGMCLLLFFKLRGSLGLLRRRQEALEEQLFLKDSTTGRESGNRKYISNSGTINEQQLKNRFQSEVENETDISEKYRHIADLERSGLGSAELSEIFDISENEASQMLSLSRSADRVSQIAPSESSDHLPQTPVSEIKCPETPASTEKRKKTYRKKQKCA